MELVDCIICQGVVRNGRQCGKCERNFCSLCIQNWMTQTAKDGVCCPNPLCKKRGDDFKPLNRIKTTLLDKIKIRCSTCNQQVSYDKFNSHQLAHHTCIHCNQGGLKNWNDIRQHYYLDCTKKQVECHSCEFIFSRLGLVSHSCLEHYKLRIFEALLLLACLLVMLLKCGIVKTMHVSECSMYGRLREYLISIIQNSVLVFWAICMFINIRSIKGSVIDLSAKRIHVTEQVKYMAAFLMCVSAILVNALTLKLNISMCSGDNYTQVKAAMQNNQAYVSTYTHYLLTMINFGVYCGALASVGFIAFKTQLSFWKAKAAANKTKSS